MTLGMVSAVAIHFIDAVHNAKNVQCTMNTNNSFKFVQIYEDIRFKFATICQRLNIFFLRCLKRG